MLELAKNCLLAEQKADTLHLLLLEPSLRTANRMMELERALGQHYQTEIRLQFDNTVADNHLRQQTPEYIRQVKQHQREQAALKTLEQMPLFQALSQCFSIKIGPLRLQE